MTPAAEGWQLRLPPDGVLPPPSETELDDELEVADRRLRIRCAACGHPVTDPSERIEVGGSHEHVQMNPLGFVFRFGCFERAPGCGLRGERELADTWFPSMAWVYAACRGCAVHLGWHWTGPMHGGFYGLILSKLVEDSESD